MKTSFIKPTAAQWFVVDAAGTVLGRMASDIATILRGKHRPEFAKHFESLDHVIVLNAAKVAVTGKKLQQKAYFHHTGYFGNLKEASLQDMLKKKPADVIHLAVKGMLPKNAMRERTLRHLHVYDSETHDHEAQKPVPIPSHLVHG